MPAVKSPLSICERRGSGRDWKRGHVPCPKQVQVVGDARRYERARQRRDDVGRAVVGLVEVVAGRSVDQHELSAIIDPKVASVRIHLVSRQRRGVAQLAGLRRMRNFVSSHGAKKLITQRPSALVGGLNVGRAWHRCPAVSFSSHPSESVPGRQGNLSPRRIQKGRAAGLGTCVHRRDSVRRRTRSAARAGAGMFDWPLNPSALPIQFLRRSITPDARYRRGAESSTCDAG